MGKNKSASNLVNVIDFNNDRIAFISGSTTLMSISSSGAVTVTGVISGSNAASASYALNAGLLNNKNSAEFTSTGSFNTYTSSNDATVTSVAGAAVSAVAGVNALAARTSSYTTTSSFNSYTASNNTTMSCVSSTATSAIVGVGALAAQTGSYSTTGSNTFVGGAYFSSSFNPTGFSTTASLYTDGGLRVTRDAYISGTLYLNNVTVFGTQSVAYISSSQLNIASNLISVNTATPSVRFGGLSVYDSGSTGLTGSILWDSQNNHWVYSNPSGSSYSGGMFISGPRTSTLGSETGTTSCMLLAGQGGDHLTSSMIYHDSTVTCIPTAIIGGSTACFASSIDAGSYIRNTNSGADAAVTIAADGVSHYISATNAARTAYRNLLLNPYGCNVGVGTTNPATKLDVIGNIRNSNAGQTVYTEIQNDGLYATGTDLYLLAPASKFMSFYTGGGERLRITSTGIACFACQICANSISGISGNFRSCTFFGSIDLENTGGDCGGKWNIQSVSGTQVGGSAGSSFGIYSYCASAYRFWINSSGNVGIGTTSPNETLDVNGTIQVRGSSLGYATTRCVGMLDFYASTTRLLSFGGNSTTCGGFRFYSAAQNNAGGSDVATISGAGAACFSSTIQASGATVASDVVGDPVYLRVRNNNTGGYPSSLALSVYGYAAAASYYDVLRIQGSYPGYGSANFIVKYQPNSSDVVALTLRGDGYMFSVPTYNNTWPGSSANMYVASDGSFGRVTASSGRFKENIIDWSGNGLNTILALKPKTFKYKKDYVNSDLNFLGLIAEEVAEVLPYLAEYENKDRTGLVENVRYDTIVVPLIAAIQEQQCTICSQASMINTLKTCLGIS